MTMLWIGITLGVVATVAFVALWAMVAHYLQVRAYQRGTKGR